MMLPRITARIGESWRPKESALERAKTFLEQAKQQKEEGRNDDALSSLIHAKAALKRHLKNGTQIIQTQRRLAELHQLRAQILPLTQDFTIEQVRQSYLKAQVYSPDTAQQEEIQAGLDHLARSPNSATPQRRPTLPPSAVPPAPVLATGLPSPFFTRLSPPSPVTQNYQLVGPDEIKDTRHLAWCLQQPHHDTAQRKQLRALAREVIERFGQRAGKDLVCLQEAAELAVVPSLELYRQLVAHTVTELNPAHHPTLDMGVVQGLAVIVRNCPEALLKKEGSVRADTWTSTLSVLITRLNTVYKGQPEPIKELIEAISQLLDAMVQAGVSGISRLQLQNPLADLLRDEDQLNPHQDTDLAWRIRYAREALAYIPNDESTAKAVLRCLFSASKGVLSLAGAVKNCDVDKLLESFDRFEETFAGARELANTVGSIGGLKEATKNVEEMLASFKEVKTSYEDRTRQKGWYTALQCLDMLIETKEWEKFEQFIRQSAYRQHAYFLQGVCHRLERIICIEEDETIQKQAIQFLKSLDENAAQWLGLDGGKLSISQSENKRVQHMAQASLARLDKRADTTRGLEDNDSPLDWYALSRNNLSTQLLQTARRKLDKSLVEKLFNTLTQHIKKLRTDYLADIEQDKEIKDALANYVPPEGMGLYDDTRFDLTKKIHAFLASDKKSLVLLGEAGAGKSTLSRHVVRHLWHAYMQANKPEEQAIPVFIALSSLPNTSPNLVNTFFKQQGFSEEQIHTLQTQHRFVLILDGFDEIEDRHRDFYKDNQLAAWKHAKIIISSRPEYLGAGYQYKFHPSGEPTALQEYRLAPFSPETIARYVEQYSENHPHASWHAEDYKKALREPNLQALVSNPFLLKMAVSELPNLSTANVQGSRLTRLSLYAQFVKSWFARSQQRLARIQLDTKEKEEFKRLEGEGFDAHQMDFSQELAIQMYQAGEVVSSYTKMTSSLRGKSKTHDEPDWRVQLLSNDHIETKLKRLNAPLIAQDKANGLGKTYRFIHKSLRDYFVARTLWEEFEEQGVLSAEAWLNTLNIVDDPAILDFLSERVKQEASFKDQLLAIIKRTKLEANLAQSAANAITVLVRAGVPFISADLQDIRIPGADLSYGVFDSAQLQGADLSNTTLTGIWLRNADLTGARMDWAQFGELPSLQFESSVNACCYSPDGRYLVAAVGDVSEPGKLALYEVETLAHVHTFEGHTDGVTSVAFSPDGQTLASGSWDHTVRLWSVAKKKLLHTFDGHTDKVTSVAFSSDDQTLASGSWDRTVRLWSWSVAEKKPLHTFKGHTSLVESVAFSPDGRTLTSGSWDNRVRLWSVAEKKPLLTFEGHTSYVTSVAFSSDGQTLASGSWDNTVRLWSVAKKKLLHMFKEHTRLVESVAFSPDGRTLTSGSEDNTVRLWSVAEKKPVHTFEGHTREVTSVAFSRDGQTLASGSWDNRVRLWSVAEQKPVHTAEGHTSLVESVAFSRDGQTLASGSGDNTVRLWSVAEQKPVHTFEGHTSRVKSVAFSSDGQTLASGSWDNTVRLWSVAKKKPVHTFEGHTRSVTSVAFSRGGQTLASGSGDNTVRLWSVAKKKPVHTFDGHTNEVTSVVFSHNGQTLASGSEDNTVRLWSVAKQKPVHTFEGHTSGVTSVAFSPDGQTLASGSGDQTVRLWSVAKKKPVHTFEGHTHKVSSVVFSRDGQTLASGSWDKTVRLWSITSGQCLTVIQGFNGDVNSVAWYTSAEGVWLATGGDDKVIRLWQVHRDGEACRVTLHWASAQTTLTTPDMCIQDVIGLSARNTQLLKQRGATGEPHQTEKQEARLLPTESAEAPAFTLPAQADSRSGSIHLNIA